MKKLIPVVTRNFLVFLAGYTWICVGTLLIYRAYSWLSASTEVNSLLYAGSGVFIALFIHHFGFMKIVNRNLKRIHSMEEKAYITSFIHKKSYLVIVVMITGGMLLRHSTVPRQYLAVLYTGIGSALLLSSMRYLQVCVREFRKQRRSEVC